MSLLRYCLVSKELYTSCEIMFHCIVYSRKLRTSGINDAVKCADVTLGIVSCKNTYSQPEFKL